MKIYIILDNKNNSTITNFYLIENEENKKFLKYKGEKDIELSSNSEDIFKEILEIKKYLERELEKDYGIDYCVISNNKYISRDIIGYFHQIFSHSGNLEPVRREYASKVELIDLENIKNTFKILKDMEINNLLLYTEQEIKEICENSIKDENKKYSNEIEKLKQEIKKLKEKSIDLEYERDNLKLELDYLKKNK